MSQKKNKTILEPVKQTPLPEAECYVQFYPAILEDGNKYMLCISQKDHRWYKQKELKTYQVDPKNNTVMLSEYGDPVKLTAKDIKFLDK